MKKNLIILLLGFCFLFPSLAQSQPDKFFERFLGPMLQPGDLKVLQLEMNPDPVREGQWLNFQAVVSNLSRHSGRVNLFIKDRDEVVAQLNDVLLPHGAFDFSFPFTRYQFQRFDHCFTVIVDVERTPYRVDAAREFCARPYGWSLRP